MYAGRYVRLCDVGFRSEGGKGDDALEAPCHVCELLNWSGGLQRFSLVRAIVVGKRHSIRVILFVRTRTEYSFFVL